MQEPNDECNINVSCFLASREPQKLAVMLLQSILLYLTRDWIGNNLTETVPNSLLKRSQQGELTFSHLRSVRHPYSKIVVEAEDNVAEAFVRIGKFELAEQHCIASIKVFLLSGTGSEGATICVYIEQCNLFKATGGHAEFKIQRHWRRGGWRSVREVETHLDGDGIRMYMKRKARYWEEEALRGNGKAGGLMLLWRKEKMKMKI
ncbi:N-lysine methyltransferase SMYD2-A isoform X1 [Canna indica]|uniref:N-lysine methyltransferase SMYD2-A isoform X1 n=1 Tax=Canna indica TaxID=4628 RepID=A0AAQ3K3J5_9LILI|nr:N-lysine methyltransferase SMYD2-A isoform X1 [Canna indica]